MPKNHGAILIECHGDSTTWGADPARRYVRMRRPPPAVTQARLRREGLEVEVRNCGVKGATAASLLGLGRPALQRWAAQMRQCGAQVIVINLGINDAYGQRSVPRALFARRLRRLAREAMQTRKRVVLETPNPVSLHAPLGSLELALRVSQLADAASLVARQLRLPLCDQHRRIQDLPNWASHLPDGIHPSAWLAAQKGRFLAETLDPWLRSTPWIAERRQRRTQSGRRRIHAV